MYRTDLISGTMRSCCRIVLLAVLPAELLETQLVGGTSATAVVQEMVVAEALVGVVLVQR